MIYREVCRQTQLVRLNSSQSEIIMEEKPPPQSSADTPPHSSLEDLKNPTHSSVESIVAGEIEEVPEPSGIWARFIWGFGPADRGHVDYTGMSPMEIAALKTANSPLQRNLKGRHLQMIAIGGSIGTGLFIGSGSTLSRGGPAALLIAYGVTGVMLLMTMHALGEMAVCFPVSGGYFTLFTRFIDPGWGVLKD